MRRICTHSAYWYILVITGILGVAFFVIGFPLLLFSVDNDQRQSIEMLAWIMLCGSVVMFLVSYQIAFARASLRKHLPQVEHLVIKATFTTSENKSIDLGALSPSTIVGVFEKIPWTSERARADELNRVSPTLVFRSTTKWESLSFSVIGSVGNTNAKLDFFSRYYFELANESPSSSKRNVLERHNLSYNDVVRVLSYYSHGDHLGIVREFRALNKRSSITSNFLD